MARVPAFGTAWIKFGRLKRVGRWIIGPLGICPSVRVRESLSLGLAGWPGPSKNCHELYILALSGQFTRAGEPLPQLRHRSEERNQPNCRHPIWSGSHGIRTYVLTHYGPGDTSITEQQVNEVRRGGPSSPLLPLARGGLAAATVIVILGAAFLIFRRRKASA